MSASWIKIMIQKYAFVEWLTNIELQEFISITLLKFSKSMFLQWQQQINAVLNYVPSKMTLLKKDL